MSNINQPLEIAAISSPEQSARSPSELDLDQPPVLKRERPLDLNGSSHFSSPASSDDEDASYPVDSSSSRYSVAVEMAPLCASVYTRARHNTCIDASAFELMISAGKAGDTSQDGHSICHLCCVRALSVVEYMGGHPVIYLMMCFRIQRKIAAISLESGDGPIKAGENDRGEFTANCMYLCSVLACTVKRGHLIQWTVNNRMIMFL